MDSLDDILKPKRPNRKEYQKQWALNNKDKVKEKAKKYRESHKEKIKEELDKWRQKNKEHIREYAKNRRQSEEYKAKRKETRHLYEETHKELILEQRRTSYFRKKAIFPDCDRDSSYRNLYGIGITEYNKLLLEQNGLCAICKERETFVLRGKIKPLSIDHDHSKGYIRGLLCHLCNVSLGFADESVRVLENSITYLQNPVFTDKKPEQNISCLLEENILSEIDTRWKRDLRNKFGITEHVYFQILIVQNRNCAICLKPESSKRNGKIKRLAVDHDHNSGCVRGLLCQKCNCLLGSVKDNVDRIESLIGYLRKHSSNGTN